MGTCPHDGKFYTSGNFEGKHEYNPSCNLCKAHGSYSLIGKDGKEYTFYNASYEMDLIDFIAGWETLSLTRNKDGTIGFGYTIFSNDKLLYDITGSYNPSNITERQAYMLLMATVQKHEIALYSKYSSDILGMTLHQKNAVLDYSYNVGNAKPIITNLRKMDDYTAWTSTGISGRDKNGNLVVMSGLVKRRKADYNIFAYGIYDSAH